MKSLRLNFPTNSLRRCLFAFYSYLFLIPHAHAQIDLLTPQLFEVMIISINSKGDPVQDIQWPSYPLLDANGFHGILDDVMGPYGVTYSYSVPDRILWSQTPNLKLQARYDDFGGTCDLNNPNANFTNQVMTPANPSDVTKPKANTGNGLEDNFYQKGTYTTCASNPHFSQENFNPLPLLTRLSWTYRACKMLAVRSSSCQIARFAARVSAPDLTAPSNPMTGFEEVALSKGDRPSVTEPNCNWCQMISYPNAESYQRLFRAFYPGRSIPKIPSVNEYTTKSLTQTKIEESFQLKFVSQNSRIMNTPRYYEKLLELVSQSDAFIDELIQGNNGQVNPVYLNLEDTCNSSPANGVPTIEQLKAINAWRALLHTFCMDPGVQIK